MEKIYVTLLLNGRKTWADVPANLQPKVDAILKEYVANGIITEEEYKQLTATAE